MKKKKKKHAKKKEKKEKDFCDACGLFIEVSEDYPEKSSLLKKLKDLNIRKNGIYGKKVFFTYGKPPLTKVCVVGSKRWMESGNRRILWMERRCEDFQVKWPFLELPNFISIYTTKRNSRIANRLTITAIVIAVVGLLLIIFSAEVKCFLKNLF